MFEAKFVGIRFDLFQACLYVLSLFFFFFWVKQEMISGVQIHLVIQTVHSGYKVVIWFTVLTIACGWVILYTQTGICSSQIILVLNFTLLLELSLVDQFTSAILWVSTILISSKPSSCPTVPFSAANTTRFLLAIVSSKTLFTMEKPCSRFGTSTRYVTRRPTSN